MNRVSPAALLCAALLPFAALACGPTTDTAEDPIAVAPTAAVDASAGQTNVGAPVDTGAVQDPVPAMPVTQLCASDPTLPDVSGDGFTELDGGLKIKDVVVGTGAEIQPGTASAFHYAGFLEDGTRFDTSCSRGMPLPTDLSPGSMIDGWISGIPGMKVGGRRILVIPGPLGYGSSGNPGAGIGPDATLIFDIEAMASK